MSRRSIFGGIRFSSFKDAGYSDYPYPFNAENRLFTAFDEAFPERVGRNLHTIGSAAPSYTENGALTTWKKLPKPFVPLGSISSWPKRQRAAGVGCRYEFEVPDQHRSFRQLPRSARRHQLIMEIP
jgi:hypothetical protein